MFPKFKTCSFMLYSQTLRFAQLLAIAVFGPNQIPINSIIFSIKIIAQISVEVIDIYVKNSRKTAIICRDFL